MLTKAETTFRILCHPDKTSTFHLVRCICGARHADCICDQKTSQATGFDEEQKRQHSRG